MPIDWIEIIAKNILKDIIIGCSSSRWANGYCPSSAAPSCCLLLSSLSKRRSWVLPRVWVCNKDRLIAWLPKVGSHHSLRSDSPVILCGTYGSVGALMPAPFLRKATFRTECGSIWLPSWTYRIPLPILCLLNLLFWGFMARWSRECRTSRRYRTVHRCG